eukprot:3940095-Rhodomonas_salina.4
MSDIDIMHGARDIQAHGRVQRRLSAQDCTIAWVEFGIYARYTCEIADKKPAGQGSFLQFAEGRQFASYTAKSIQETTNSVHQFAPAFRFFVLDFGGWRFCIPGLTQVVTAYQPPKCAFPKEYPPVPRSSFFATCCPELTCGDTRRNRNQETAFLVRKRRFLVFDFALYSANDSLRTAMCGADRQP